MLLWIASTCSSQPALGLGFGDSMRPPRFSCTHRTTSILRGTAGSAGSAAVLLPRSKSLISATRPQMARESKLAICSEVSIILTQKESIILTSIILTSIILTLSTSPCSINQAFLSGGFRDYFRGRRTENISVHSLRSSHWAVTPSLESPATRPGPGGKQGCESPRFSEEEPKKNVAAKISDVYVDYFRFTYTYGWFLLGIFFMDNLYIHV